jgi:cell division protein FtsL
MSESELRSEIAEKLKERDELEQKIKDLQEAEQ